MNAGIFLEQAFKQGKLSHAYLFSGNDEQKKQKVVSDFLSKTGCSASDIYEVSSEHEITIAQIRQLSSQLSLAPWASPFKVSIIRSAHRMNWEAQGALLKLLEEPKGSAIFFLLTKYPFLLLPTIFSRAQEIRFWAFDTTYQTDKTYGSYRSDLQKVQRASVQERFAYAKKVVDSEQNAAELLEEWLRVFRKDLFASAPILRTIQETLHLLQTTNVSPRLALERILLLV
ncbi:MAG: hypothetical protein HYS52_00300 [Candidatus Wildermuthbacteria bacterium]|nr:hypothetical protein [Candidatus Wildermuthbacteria bacterium]